MNYEKICGLILINILFSACSSSNITSSNRYYEDSNRLKIDMIKVEGGEFMMGCEDRANLCEMDEIPSHRVKLDDYYISKYEITNRQYAKFCRKTDRELPFQKKTKHKRNAPVVNVNWIDATDFCSYLSKLSGKNYRLPTEAQWEYAAKGGKYSKDYIYSGSNDINKVAIAKSSDSPAKDVAKVGKKVGNELGIYDMSGNAWEWCSDDYDEHYYKKSPTINPINKDSILYKVARGGGWANSPKYHIITNRDNDKAERKDYDLGFRIIMIYDKNQ